MISNIYISYKVIGDKFTYVTLDKNNNRIDNEINLYVDGIVNPKAMDIVKSIIDLKKKISKAKNDSVTPELSNNLSEESKKSNEIPNTQEKNIASVSPRDTFNSIIESISKEEIEIIKTFITENPPTIGSKNSVDRIKAKYGFDDKMLLTAYAIISKKMKKEITNTKQPLTSSLETKEILISMVRKLVDAPFLTRNEIVEEIDRISLNTHITKDEINSLYMKELIKKQVKDIIKNKVNSTKEAIEETVLSKADKVKEIIKANGRKVINKEAILKNANNAKEVFHKKLLGSKIASKYLNRNKKENNLIDWGDININPKLEMINRAEGLIKPELNDKWKEMIFRDGGDIVPIYTALNVMLVMKNGGTIKEACKEMEKSHNFILNKKKIVDLVIKYSTFGNEFEQKTRKYLMTKPERLEKFVLDKSGYFKEVINKDIDKVVNLKIAKLKELKSYISDVNSLPASMEQDENNKSL